MCVMGLSVRAAVRGGQSRSASALHAGSVLGPACRSRHYENRQEQGAHGETTSRRTEIPTGVLSCFNILDHSP